MTLPRPRRRRPHGRSPRTPRLGVLGLALFQAACASRGPTVGPSFAPGGPEVGWTETGVASWYGEPFHGRPTASGAVYDMDGPTAAHRTLPFGTVVKVENRDNGRTVELTINDRGPFAKGRILDVSRAGARALGMIGPGTARVRITVLRPGGDAVAVRGGCVVVQVAAFRDAQAAARRAAEVERAGIPVRVERHESWHRVVAGPFASEDSALAALDALDGFLRRCA